MRLAQQGVLDRLTAHDAPSRQAEGLVGIGLLGLQEVQPVPPADRHRDLALTLAVQWREAECRQGVGDGTWPTVTASEDGNLRLHRHLPRLL